LGCGEEADVPVLGQVGWGVPPLMFDASVLVSDNEGTIPWPYVLSPSRPSPHAVGASLADSDAEVHVPRNPPPSALVSCDSDHEALIPRPMRSCPSSTSCPIVPRPSPQPCRRGRSPPGDG
jgi:hypothetical protein